MARRILKDGTAEEIVKEPIAEEKPKKKELSLDEEFAQLAGTGNFEKLAKLRAKIEKKLPEDQSLTELFWKVNDEMKKSI